MSFHHKSAWACLLSTTLIWGAFFALVISRPAEQSGDVLPAIVAAIVLQTVVMICSHIVFGLIDRDHDRFDERDRSIALRSSSWAGWILSIGVFFCIVFLPMREVALHMDPPGRLATGALAGPFTTGIVLLMWFVLSEVVHYSAQVLLYRRG